MASGGSTSSMESGGERADLGGGGDSGRSLSTGASAGGGSGDDVDAPQPASPPPSPVATRSRRPTHKRNSRILNFVPPPGNAWSLVVQALQPIADGSAAVLGVGQLEEAMAVYWRGRGGSSRGFGAGSSAARGDGSRGRRATPKLAALRVLARRNALPQGFFRTVIPFMAATALRLPKLVAEPIPVLAHNRPGVVSLSRAQVACLLSNMFLCTMTRAASTGRVPMFPESTFYPLLSATEPQEVAKVECFLHYFARVSGAVQPQPPSSKGRNDDGGAGESGGAALPRPQSFSERAAEFVAATSLSVTVAGRTIDDDSHPDWRPGTPMASLGNADRLGDSPDGASPVGMSGSPAHVGPPSPVAGLHSHHDSGDVDMERAGFAAVRASAAAPSSGPPALGADAAGAAPAAMRERFTTTPPPFAGARAFGATGAGAGVGAGAGGAAAGSRCDPTAALAALGGTLHFRRVQLKAEASSFWSSLTQPLAPLELETSGGIEDAHGCLQADFANKYIGGGVIVGGCVQEEIRFAINPELTASLLFCAFMKDDEALILTGAERFCDYTGYAFQLQFGGPHVDQTPRASDGSVATSIVAFDALPFAQIGYRGFQMQHSPKGLLRELNKAAVAFQPVPDSECSMDKYRTIATGNWGCGAFGGDVQLKSILQWLAASRFGRPLRYYSFSNPKVAQLGDIADMLRQRGATVGQVWRDVVAYGTTVNTRGRGSRGRGLFYYLVTRWGSGPSAGVRTEPAGQGAPDGSALSAPAPTSAAASGEGDAASGTSGLEDGTAATASPHAQSEP